MTAIPGIVNIENKLHEPCLQWVKVNGEIHHVSDFSHLPSNQRPEAFCPVCHRLVLLKLGQIRIHHAAHYEGVACPTSQPETVIHLNAKYHIKRELSSTNRKLQIWQYCTGWEGGSFKHTCTHQNKRELLYLEDWDQIEDEWSYRNYRLDIAILKNKQVVGAIEILVTHPSEENKIDYLNQQNIAWVEIKVGQDFYTPPTEWKVEVPLETINHNRLLSGKWQCKDCIDLYKKEEIRLEEEKQYLKERQRKLEYAKQFETKFLRVIDYYFPSGKKYRSIYAIQTKSKNGGIISAELQEIGAQRRQIKIEYPPVTEHTFELLKQALKVGLREKKEKPGWIIDNSTGWFKPPARFDPKQLLDMDEYPYNFELINNKWERIKRVKRNSSSSIRSFEPHYFIPKKPIETEEYSKPKSAGNGLAFLNEILPCEKCGQITSDWLERFGKTKTCICRECANQAQSPSKT